MSLLSELKRRNVFRVAAAYVAISWLVIQVVETLLPAFQLSLFWLRFTTVVLIVGFFPAVALAWLFELTPDGIRRDRDADRHSPLRRRMLQRADRIIVLLLSVAIGWFLYDRLIPEPGTEDEAAYSDSAKSSAESVDAIIESYGSRSVAVLPFDNLSDDPQQRYFSDGVAEDILGRLSSIEGLRVISRSSSFQLRDAGLTMPEIAERLRVTYVMAGSVRQYEDEVRVSVRLVDARSDTQVWFENYDRQLKDIFRIQDEISAAVTTAIAPALNATVTAGGAPAGSSGAYRIYLQARDEYLTGRRERDVARIRTAKSMFEDALVASSDFAPAHAGIADAWSSLAIFGAVTTEEGYAESRRSALRALELDDTVMDAWLALGDVQFEFDWDAAAALRSYRRALELQPSNAEALRSLGYLLVLTGHFEESIDIYRRAVAADPLSERPYVPMYLAFLQAGQTDAAERLLDDLSGNGKLHPAAVAGLRRYGLLREDRIDEAADLLPDQPWHPVDWLHTAIVQRHRGDLAAAEASIQQILTSDLWLPSNRIVGSYYAMNGERDKAIDYLSRSIEQRELVMHEALTDPFYQELRTDPRFWRLLEQAGVEPLELQGGASD